MQPIEVNLNDYKIEIYTRSMNKYLWSLSQKTIDLPYKRKRLTGTKEHGYLYKMMKSKADFVINIDEDAFVFDNEKLIALLKYCIAEDIVVCGPPDGGVIKVRVHNPVSINPFFTIFNIKKMKENGGFSTKMLAPYMKHKPEFEKNAPYHLIKGDYQFDDYERYYPFFFWATQNFKTLYLDCDGHKDGYTSILLDHEGQPFLNHTWYTRAFGADDFHTDRIFNIIRESFDGKIPYLPKQTFLGRIFGEKKYKGVI